MGCAIHHAGLWFGDCGPISAGKGLSMPNKAESAVLFRGHTHRGPLDVDPVPHFPQQGPLSGNSRLVDHELCENRLGDRLWLTFHPHPVRRCDYITTDAYRQHGPQSTYCCIEDCILSHCERVIDGKHFLLLLETELFAAGLFLKKWEIPPS